MPAILSPQPLAARGPRFSIHSVSDFPIYQTSFVSGLCVCFGLQTLFFTRLTPCPQPIPMSHGRASISHPRLMSPIQLDSPVIRPPSVIPKPIPKPPAKRRGKPTSRPPRRRRPLSCVECPVDPPTHAFDHLPWISALETAPDHYSSGDIADLSQFDNCSAPNLPPSGPGPIRRRKTSLRTNPLSPAQLPLIHSFPGDSSWAAGSTLPFCDTPNQFDSLSPPITPNPRFDPSRALFHNLMPVSCDPHTDGPNDYKFTSFHH
ncbi:hypothetical protein BDZ94DRAFT_216316 [Collybia nuda]|uniref:Uncharacterized protein n=1 Tax=Collybia nuda TaxID=64659 RepID=A0A9P6CHM4_9AGAR|nr:hypothetical protein BDZ94DRAFT_216316 [Collybia nuda]